MNKRLFIILLAVLIILPQFVHAKEGSENEVEVEAENHVETRAETRESNLQERQQKLKDRLEERSQKLASKAAEMRSKIQERRDEFKKRKEELASKAAEMREGRKERRVAFQNKLKEFKDDKKASLAARIDANIDRINKNHTERYTDVLEKLNEIVGRLEDKVASASALGKDTASASAAITTAKAKISAAQSAVSQQSGKDYAPTVTSETTLGAVVSEAFKAFIKDMQAVQALVVDAKQAARAAAEAVMQLK